jgi:hypothetical protein
MRRLTTLLSSESDWRKLILARASADRSHNKPISKAYKTAAGNMLAFGEAYDRVLKVQQKV